MMSVLYSSPDLDHISLGSADIPEDVSSADELIMYDAVQRVLDTCGADSDECLLQIMNCRSIQFDLCGLSDDVYGPGIEAHCLNGSIGLEVFLSLEVPKYNEYSYETDRRQALKALQMTARRITSRRYPDANVYAMAEDELVTLCFFFPIDRFDEDAVASFMSNQRLIKDLISLLYNAAARSFVHEI